jgi:hypothetical protein
MFEIIIGIVAIMLVEVEIVMDGPSCCFISHRKVGENKRMAIGQTLIFPVIDDSR